MNTTYVGSEVDLSLPPGPHKNDQIIVDRCSVINSQSVSPFTSTTNIVQLACQTIPWVAARIVIDRSFLHRTSSVVQRPVLFRAVDAARFGRICPVNVSLCSKSPKPLYNPFMIPPVNS